MQIRLLIIVEIRYLILVTFLPKYIRYYNVKCIRSLFSMFLHRCKSLKNLLKYLDRVLSIAVENKFITSNPIISFLWVRLVISPFTPVCIRRHDICKTFHFLHAGTSSGKSGITKYHLRLKL